MNDGSVNLKNLVKTYVDDRGRAALTAVKGINLEIKDGEFMVLVGPSGCGKTTTLRLIAGLEQITSGTVEIGGVVVNQVEPKNRGVAMVFQNYALYPHMTVFENLAFGLKVSGKKREFIQATVMRVATALGLDTMLDRKPQSLSGGQRQRVALGRAMVRDPKVFLFDEPLSNLDAKMRVQMRAEIARLHAELKTTMIYVTHDQVEAMTLGNRICVMREGAIMQTADPVTVYRCPQNVFVAGFIGSPLMNLLAGQVERRDGGLVFAEEAPAGLLKFPLQGRLEKLAERHLGRKIVFGVRPEHLAISGSRASHLPVPFTVELAEPMGAESILYLKAGARSLTARIFGEHFYQPGEALDIYINMEKAHLFDGETGSVIS